MQCYNSIMADRHAEEEARWDDYLEAIYQHEEPILSMKVEEFLDLLKESQFDQVTEIIGEVAEAQLLKEIKLAQEP